MEGYPRPTNTQYAQPLLDPRARALPQAQVIAYDTRGDVYATPYATPYSAPVTTTPNRKKSILRLAFLVILVGVIAAIILVVVLPKSSDDNHTPGTWGVIMKEGYTAGGGVDINNDGRPDAVIGTGTTARVFFVYGRDVNHSFDNPFYLSGATLEGPDGFIALNYRYGVNVGYDVRGAGDVNGDGIDDVVIGAPFADVENNETSPNSTYVAGQAFVLFGRSMIGTTQPFEPIVDLDTLDGTTGFSVNGTVAGALIGFSAAGLGDINGDGFGDLLVSGAWADEQEDNSTGYPARAGLAFVIFGRTSFPASLTASKDDFNGQNGFAIGGLELHEAVAIVDSLGDVNSDGINDLIFSTSLFNLSTPSLGRAFVIFGRPSYPAFIDIADLNGTNGFAFIPTEVGSRPVANIGDVNGDNINDIIIGNTDQTFLIFGRSSVNPFPATLSPSQINGDIGRVLLHDDMWVGTRSLDGVGDVNYDGINDILLGAGFGQNGAGRSYLIFGKNSTDEWPYTNNLNTLDGEDGVQIVGVRETTQDGRSVYLGDYSGSTVSRCGDMNGDGFIDFLIGAREGGDYQQGAVYLIYGRNLTADSWPASLGVSDLQ